MCQSRRTICYNRDTYHSVICLFCSIKCRRRPRCFSSVTAARWDGRGPIKGNGTNLIVRHLTVAARLAPPCPASLSPHRRAFQLMHSGRERGSSSRQVHLPSEAPVTDDGAQTGLPARPFTANAGCLSITVSHKINQKSKKSLIVPKIIFVVYTSCTLFSVQ